MFGNKKRFIWIALAVLVLAAAGIFLFGGFGAGGKQAYETEAAARGNLTVKVSATGTLRARQSALMAWQTAGRVEKVSVALGDSVRAGQELAALAPVSLSQGIILAQADLVSAQKNLDDLLISNSALAQSQQSLAAAKQAYSDAQDAYDHLNRPRMSNEVIKDTQDQINNYKRQLKFQQWFFNLIYGHLYDGSPAKSEQQLKLMNTQDNIDSLTAKLNWYTSKPDPLEVEKALAAVNVAKAQMDDAQRAVDRYDNGKNASDIAAARARVAAAQATLDRAKIIAPFNGTVTQLDAAAGDMITQGQSAVLVEDLTHQYIDLDISEVDINNLSVGQNFTASFDSVPGVTYHGQVDKIALAGESAAGAVAFPVTVLVTDADQALKPGMTAAVTIAVREVTDALLVPNRAVRFVGADRVVYVLQNRQAVPVNIQLGAISDLYSQVTGGDLKEGDLVILNPPAVSSGS